MQAIPPPATKNLRLVQEVLPAVLRFRISFETVQKLRTAEKHEPWSRGGQHWSFWTCLLFTLLLYLTTLNLIT